MDKKTIIGLVLIFAIFVGYMWWVSPSKEEIAEKRHQDSIRWEHYQDSIEQVRIADSIAAVLKAEQGLSDSAFAEQQSLTRQQQQLGMFGANTGASLQLKVENEEMMVAISSRGASVQQVVLKDFTTFDKMPLELISAGEENMNLIFSTNDNRVINTRDLTFTPFVDGQPVVADAELEVKGDSMTVAYRAFANAPVADSAAASVNDGTQYLEFAYVFYPNSNQVGFHINFHGLTQVVRSTPSMDFQWSNSMNRQEKVDVGSRGSNRKDNEKMYTNLFYKPAKESPESLRMGGKGDKQMKTPVEWVAFKQQFFTAILMCENEDIPFENADMRYGVDDAKDTNAHYLCDMNAIVGLTYDSEKDCSMDMRFYYGSTKYRTLRQEHRSLEQLVPLGNFFLTRWVGKWGIIPLFNWMERFIKNYGIIIILLTIIFRTVVFPLTFKSYQSSAIMRILRPEMQALNEKYPNQDQAMQKQQEMSRLQKRAGINPLMGCLPVLIQFPILMAMYRFYPASIELRQKQFLWCDDLSTYDSILDFGFNIPLYGDHISLFCLLMFGMQFFYTWYTMRDQSSQMTMPGMKFMMYFMPFMMLFIFNSQSAALNIYYFCSLLITMTQMILIRKFTSEKKVRARMAAYDAKQKNNPNKKKSNFQKRLEEMQRMSEQMQKQQNRK